MPLKFITWNVQHGSAAYIQTPNGKRIAIDLGAGADEDASFSPLLYLKREWGISQLDLVVITHPHLDHIEDILNFDNLNPRTLIRPAHLTDDDIWAGKGEAGLEIQQTIAKYIEINSRYIYPCSPQDNPLTPANNGGVSFQVFSPCQSSTTNLNNHSIVIVMEYGGVKFLLPGDNEPPSWDELLARPDFKEAIAGVHVLVAPHHGRESGFHSELFKHFKPLITIISDGRFLDTSATSRYSSVTKGSEIGRQNGIREERKCITTRKDGSIYVEVNRNLYGQSFLNVIVD